MFLDVWRSTLMTVRWASAQENNSFTRESINKEKTQAQINHMCNHQGRMENCTDTDV